MLNLTPLGKIKEACIKANPSIETRNVSVLIPQPFSGIVNYRDSHIGLADVLYVMELKREEIHGMRFEKDAWFDGLIPTIISGWHLNDDDLEHQSPECINFLAELL